MDKEIEKIIAEESGGRSWDGGPSEDELEFGRESSGSDAYSDADERQELIELENDAVDTLVDESQDVSTEGID